MASQTSGLDLSAEPTTERSTLEETVRQSFVTGAALTIPAIITLIILTFVLNFLGNVLSPVVDAANLLWPGQSLPAALVQGIALVALVTFIFAVGFLIEQTAADEQAEKFHRVMESIPGLGSIYTSFNEMSELLLDSDTESFQEVKLVEYPTEGSYVVAFLTARTPDVIGEATGNGDMETLFMPMAPNPVMGGFVIHVDSDRVVDVDMTVEEGIRSIVTSGVAIGEGGPRAAGLTERELRELGAFERVGHRSDGDDRREETGELADRRRAAYDAQVSPEHADTADNVEYRREMARDEDETGALTPEELERQREE